MNVFILFLACIALVLYLIETANVREPFVPRLNTHLNRMKRKLRVHTQVLYETYGKPLKVKGRRKKLIS